MNFGTKAETLKNLFGKLRNADVLPAAVFTVREWLEDPEHVYAAVMQEPWSRDVELIIRSSAINEDLEQESMAGKFESVLHVKGREGFYRGVDTVLASYQEDKNPDNQFFVQPMLAGVHMSGVVFTMDPNTGGNYYVINYDDRSGSTSSVTGGSGTQLKTFYCFKGYEKPTGYAQLDKLLSAVRELEALFESNALDIEFAQTEEGALYILQVRALVLREPGKELSRQGEVLGRIYEYLKRADGPKPHLFGKKALYSVMTDWNPAEMIGIRPKPLALSLYKNLITDGTWAYQRADYGYKDLRSFPLILDYGGLPYVDIRVSFNSFIPQTIPNSLAEKLAEYYLDRLTEHPELHDKVEFDIIFSCFTFDLPQRLKVLLDYGFTQAECDKIAEHLKHLTNRIINAKDGLWIVDSQKIDILKERQELLINGDYDIIYKIYWLLEDCRRYGTLPFAGLARAGFIAVQILRSFVSTGIFTEEEYNAYLAGLNTVGSGISADFAGLSKKAFLRKYGHLRPGTYDICSPRYDEAPERYFNWDFEQRGEPVNRNFKISIEQMIAIREYLSSFELSDDVLALFKFLKGAIEGREYSKFTFTRSLSYALKLLEELGGRYGLSREDMAYLDIEVIKPLYLSERDVEQVLRRSIEEGKRRYQDTLGIAMPPVIERETDCFYFFQGEANPNYITLGNVTGPVRFADDEDLEGAILFIPSADPGYDWIFSRKIAGFVTMYGGANSHMAIRSGELSIPAIVGAGEALYNKLSAAEVVEINCALRKADIIK